MPWGLVALACTKVEQSILEHGPQRSSPRLSGDHGQSKCGGFVAPLGQHGEQHSGSLLGERLAWPRQQPHSPELPRPVLKTYGLNWGQQRGFWKCSRMM